jgi:hypothetical protein
MSNDETVSEGQPDEAVGKRTDSRRFIVFCVLLVLALIGMAVTQASKDSAWEAWMVLVAIYGTVSTWQTGQRLRLQGKPVRPIILKQVLHWGALLVAMQVLMFLEQTDIMDRDSAADASLLMLALACFLAGVHFEWMFLVIGVVLALMVVVVAKTEQFEMWLIMIGITLAAAGLFFWRWKKGRSG